MYSLDVEAVDLCSNNRPHFQTRYGVEARRYGKMQPEAGTTATANDDLALLFLLGSLRPRRVGETMTGIMGICETVVVIALFRRMSV
jgi:hypothetical protein